LGKLRLGVLGKTPYLDRLTETMCKYAPEYLEIAQCVTYTQFGGFLDYFRADILLRESCGKLPAKLPENTVEIVLSDGEGEKEGVPVIFRYQKGREILRQIFLIYQDISKEMPVCWCKTKGLDMVAVYAPGGNEQQLLFSLSYAAACAGSEKVLYLNLAEFSGMLSLLGEKEGENFSDLIYGARQRGAQFPVVLEGVLRHAGGFDYVQPPGNPRDIYEAGERDLECLLELLERQTDYGLIVWNCSALGPVTDRVLAHCSQIICLTKENVAGRCRREDFERYLEKDDGQRLRDKITYISPAAISVTGKGAEALQQLQDGDMARQARELAGLRREKHDAGDGTAETAHTDATGSDKGE